MSWSQKTVWTIAIGEWTVAGSMKLWQQDLTVQICCFVITHGKIIANSSFVNPACIVVNSLVAMDCEGRNTVFSTNPILNKNMKVFADELLIT